MKERSIFHILDAEAWHRSGDSWEPESLLAEGFIHCSFRHQVYRSLSGYFSGVPGLAVLEIDPFATSAAVIAEPGSAGEIDADGNPELFPHLYGALPRTAVLAILDTDLFRPWERLVGSYRISDDPADFLTLGSAPE